MLYSAAQCASLHASALLRAVRSALLSACAFATARIGTRAVVSERMGAGAGNGLRAGICAGVLALTFESACVSALGGTFAWYRAFAGVLYVACSIARACKGAIQSALARADGLHSAL